MSHFVTALGSSTGPRDSGKSPMCELTYSFVEAARDMLPSELMPQRFCVLAVTAASNPDFSKSGCSK